MKKQDKKKDKKSGEMPRKKKKNKKIAETWIKPANMKTVSPIQVDFSKIEEKWQFEWEKAQVFKVQENKGNKFYVLEMFPYPSASGLHMGHALNYTIGDIFARFKRMQGFNVLHPMGYDSLGLPAENAAIKNNIPPKKYTEDAIENFIKQQKSLGLSYDWSRKVETHKPEYYKWDQWIFLKMFEKDLAFKKASPVNFCNKCATVLANEQVHNGYCWRHKDEKVEIKKLEQWFFKITDYADELYEGLNKLDDWPDRILFMQKNWIGKSHGTEIQFEINSQNWPIFTTRPDTIYGVTFMVVSSQHLRLMELVTEKQKKEVEKFLEKIKSTSEKDSIELDKEGVFTGSYALNPITKEKIPIWVGNFVVSDYGSGMVMAVPSHDQRDFEFAKKYKIPMKLVIQPKNKKVDEKNLMEAYTEDGILIKSDKFNGLDNKKAIEEITKFLEKNKLGKRAVQYRLRDWLISRQRYWGTPIPIIYCDKCGVVPVPEEQLPVVLPEKVEFGKGNPLATNLEFINTRCPKCEGPAKRETDTMDTFVNSSWYFLRYTDSKNEKEIFSKNKAHYWLPVDVYIGGAEHACMHLIYFRFYTKFLRDLGLIKLDEPCKLLFNQGMLHGEDNFVMSKSRGNVVLPEEVSKKYGIDTARLFIVSMASPDKDVSWSTAGIEGSLKFINRVMNFFSSFDIKSRTSSQRIESKLNRAIKEVAEDIENFRYNLAVIKLRILFETIEQESSREKDSKKCQSISKNDAESFLKILSPFCPHVAEELWHRLGNKNFISKQKWPTYRETKINLALEKQEQQIDQTIQDIKNIIKMLNEKKQTPKKIYLYVIPSELSAYKDNLSQIAKSLNIPAEVFAVNDKNKHDPQNKSGKAKPGKPAILVE